MLSKIAIFTVAFMPRSNHKIDYFTLNSFSVQNQPAPTLAEIIPGIMSKSTCHNDVASLTYLLTFQPLEFLASFKIWCLFFLEMEKKHETGKPRVFLSCENVCSEGKENRYLGQHLNVKPSVHLDFKSATLISWRARGSEQISCISL